MFGEATSSALPIGPRPAMVVLVIERLTCPLLVPGLLVPGLLVAGLLVAGLLGAGRTALVGDLLGAGDHIVDEAVLLGLLGGEPAVPVGVSLDLLERLSGVLADQLEQHLLDVQRLLRLDLDVGGGAAHAAGRLV